MGRVSKNRASNGMYNTYRQLPRNEVRLMDEWMDAHGLSAHVPEFALLVAASTLDKTQIYNYMSSRRKRQPVLPRRTRLAGSTRLACSTTQPCSKKVTFQIPVFSVKQIPSRQTNSTFCEGVPQSDTGSPKLANRYRFSIAPGVVFRNPWDVFSKQQRCALTAQQGQPSARAAI